MTTITRTLLTATIIAGTTFMSISSTHAGCGGSRRSYVPRYRPPVRYQPQPIYQPAPQPVIQHPPVDQAISQPVAQRTAPSKPIENDSSRQSTPPASNLNPSGDVQMSALQMLASMTGTESSSTQSNGQQRQFSEVGTWTATLDSGARVRLQLRAEGTFTWSATTKEGQTSNFTGTYSVTSDQLILTRSNDNQRLAGNLTRTDNDKFSFQLAGAKTSALNFIRA